MIDQYIETGEPVSSKALATSGAFEVRSATIRNEMADLEDMGFLEQLHTSGGRVPTAQAYRRYVNDLVEHEGINISHAARRKIDEALSATNLRDPEAVSKTLAQSVGSFRIISSWPTCTHAPSPKMVGHCIADGDAGISGNAPHDRTGTFIDQFESMFEGMQKTIWGREARSKGLHRHRKPFPPNPG